MSTYEILKKIHRQTIDDARQLLHTHERIYNELTQEIQQLNQQLLNERSIYDHNQHNITIILGWQKFKEYAAQHGQELEEKRIKQKKIIDRIQDELIDLFADYKKMDIMIEQRNDDDKKEEKRKILSELQDSIAIRQR